MKNVFGDENIIELKVESENLYTKITRRFTHEIKN